MKHEVAEKNAHLFAKWLRERGGILNWKSQDLGSAGRSVTTPFTNADGTPFARPGWQFTHPEYHITDPADVEVYTTRVVESFTIKLKQSQGRLVLNNASDRKVNAALERAGKDSFYRFASTGTSQGNPVNGLMFGEDTVEICVDDQRVPLPEWLEAHPLPEPALVQPK